MHRAINLLPFRSQGSGVNRAQAAQTTPHGRNGGAVSKHSTNASEGQAQMNRSLCKSSFLVVIALQ